VFATRKHVTRGELNLNAHWGGRRSNLKNKTAIWAAKDPSKLYSPMVKLIDVNKAVWKLMPFVDPLREVVFRSCAVVGSSGIVSSYENGAAIDAHDAVSRFNSAPTVGFEPHVGRRCVPSRLPPLKAPPQRFPRVRDSQRSRRRGWGAVKKCRI
jgi:hypothetical protein